MKGKQAHKVRMLISENSRYGKASLTDQGLSDLVKKELGLTCSLHTIAVNRKIVEVRVLRPNGTMRKSVLHTTLGDMKDQIRDLSERVKLLETTNVIIPNINI